MSLNAFIFIFQAISTDVNNRVMLIACYRLSVDYFFYRREIATRKSKLNNRDKTLNILGLLWNLWSKRSWNRFLFLFLPVIYHFNKSIYLHLCVFCLLANSSNFESKSRNLWIEVKWYNTIKIISFINLNVKIPKFLIMELRNVII